MSTEESDLVESIGSMQMTESGDSPSEDSGDSWLDSSDEEEQTPPARYPWPGLYYGDDIKRMISHTLNGWCSHDPKPKIYIVTPFIDEEGLEMIKDSIGDHKIEALYTRDEDDDLGSKMQEILAEENFVKLRVGPHKIEGKKHYYHCKFVAAEFPDHVEILMTSANLKSNHFFRGQIDSVHKYDVTPEAFRNEYLEKLDSYSHRYEWPAAASGGDKPEQQKKGAPYTPTKVTCYKCNEKGHYANKCPN